MIKFKLLFLFLITFLFCQPLKAQLGGGLRATGSYYLAKKDYKIPSFGGFITYDLDISQSLRLGFMMGLNHSFSITHTAFEVDTSSTPIKKEVNQNIKLNNFSIFAEYQKYLSDMTDKEFGLYAAVGLSFLSSSAESQFSNLDPNYVIPEFTIPTEKERYNQVIIRASLGYDVKISVVKWFIEAGIGMPGTTSEQKQVNNAYLPGFLEVSTGFKF